MGFDRNRDGNKSGADKFMDYLLYEEIFGEKGDEDESEYYELELEEAAYAPPRNETAAEMRKAASEAMPVEDPEDLYGFREISGKSTERILQLLIDRKNNMVRMLEQCSVESGLREVIDNRQMNRDFWLYDFAKLLEYSSLDKTQKVKLLQLLLDIFQIHSPMTAEKHYQCMESNALYQKYMNGCFGMEYGNCGVFWILLGNMSGNEGERMDLTTGFTNQHIKFLIQLEEYLRQMFPESGFGNQIMRGHIMKLLQSVSRTLNGETRQLLQDDYIINPVYPPDSVTGTE